MLTTLVFDLDGTLADTPAGIAATIAAVLAEMGYAPPAADAVLPMIGLPLEDTFRSFLPPDRWDAVPDCVIRYREIYAATAIPASRLYPGVEETLRRCRAAGYRMGIATTKISPVAEAVLSHCGILPLFDAVFGSDMTSLPKPHPELALKLLAELGSDPAQAMVVGDTSYDILMGKGAGARTCAVTYGVHPRHQLEAAGPDHIIDRFGDLASIIGLP